ncbi:MAG: hypothetical protein GXO02_00475 [Epsilonproteobacteria bacterium]|nr:hypothetical protein [Campylobacterota bacterium]
MRYLISIFALFFLIGCGGGGGGSYYIDKDRVENISKSILKELTLSPANSNVELRDGSFSKNLIWQVREFIKEMNSFKSRDLTRECDSGYIEEHSLEDGKKEVIYHSCKRGDTIYDGKVETLIKGDDIYLEFFNFSITKMGYLSQLRAAKVEYLDNGNRLKTYFIDSSYKNGDFWGYYRNFSVDINNLNDDISEIILNGEFKNSCFSDWIRVNTTNKFEVEILDEGVNTIYNGALDFSQKEIYGEVIIEDNFVTIDYNEGIIEKDSFKEFVKNCK